MEEFNHKESLSCDCDVCSMLYPGCCELLSFIRTTEHAKEELSDRDVPDIEGETQEFKPEIYQCELCGEDLHEDEGFVIFKVNSDGNAHEGITRKQCVVCYMEHGTCTSESSSPKNGRWLHLAEDLMLKEIPCYSDIIVKKENTEKERHFEKCTSQIDYTETCISDNDNSVVCEYCCHEFPIHQMLVSHMRVHNDAVTGQDGIDTDGPCLHDNCYPDLESRPEMKLFPLYTCKQNGNNDSNYYQVSTKYDVDATLLALSRDCPEYLSCKTESTDDVTLENPFVGNFHLEDAVKDGSEQMDLPPSKEEGVLGIQIIDVWSEATGYGKSVD